MLYPDWDENEFPIAYLITIRTYGTWLHGDERGSVDRHGRNLYGTPRLAVNPELERIMREEMKRAPFTLNAAQRIAVHREIEDVCDRRSYYLRALNVRTNHLHSVVSAQRKPEASSSHSKRMRRAHCGSRILFRVRLRSGREEGVDAIFGSRAPWN